MLSNTTLFIDTMVSTTIGEEERNPKTQECNHEVSACSTNWSAVSVSIKLWHNISRKRLLWSLHLLFSID